MRAADGAKVVAALATVLLIYWVIGPSSSPAPEGSSETTPHGNEATAQRRREVDTAAADSVPSTDAKEPVPRVCIPAKTVRSWAVEMGLPLERRPASELLSALQEFQGIEGYPEQAVRNLLGNPKPAIELLIGIGVTRITGRDYCCPEAIPGHTMADFARRSHCSAALEKAVRQVLLGYRQYFTGLTASFGTWYTTHRQVIWTTMYPTVTCSHAPRMCVKHDGCRFVCNPQVLLHNNGAQVRTASVGSNNEWDYEQSFVELFPENDRRKLRIATFDCTVKDPTPVPIVAALPRFRFFPQCVAPVTDASRRVFSLQSLPSFLQEAWKRDDSTPSDNGEPTYSHIDILKIDVENHEHTAFPSLLHETLRRHGTGPENILTVGQIMIEVHAGGEPIREWAVRGHMTMLHMYALGFIPATHDRNPFYDCCVEYVLPSVEFFVASEVRVALDPALSLPVLPHSPRN